MRKFFPLIALAPLLLSGCIFQPVIREITVHNAADYAAEDIAITYYHGTRGRQIERIGALQPGETRVLSVVTQDGRLGSFVTPVWIEYSMNGARFGAGSNSAACEEESIGWINSVLDIRFTITNEGFFVERFRR